MKKRIETAGNKDFIRTLAEEEYAEELDKLREEDEGIVPENWRLSPASVCLYLLGGKTPSGFAIKPKYFGERRLIELAVATILTDRALLLIGVPGTAKTWLSEHLAAAISGDSTRIVQGTSGTGEDSIRYGWNYAKLLQEGPSREAVVPSPVMQAMESGQLVRFEELTRIPSDIQDALITILSEKSLPLPELNLVVRARTGFNLIATANDRDKGVHELSSALQRRFNVVRLPLPSTLEDEITIVNYRLDQIATQKKWSRKSIEADDIRKLIVVFRELRSGRTLEGDMKLKSPSASLSTAEAISALSNAMVLGEYFENPKDRSAPLAESIISASIKDPTSDAPVIREYLDVAMKPRKDWKNLFEACKRIIDA